MTPIGRDDLLASNRNLQRVPKLVGLQRLGDRDHLLDAVPMWRHQNPKFMDQL